MDWDEIYAHLDSLYNSGELGAHDVGPYLEKNYGLSSEEAGQAHLDWIKGYDTRQPA